MYKLPSKSQYHIGNDHAIPDSAFVASSYIDGIYTQFDPKNAPHGWLDVQDTFKLNLPQSAWVGNPEDPRYSASSGMVTSALYTSGYDKATTGIVHQQFPEIETSGRSPYVGIKQKDPEVLPVADTTTGGNTEGGNTEGGNTEGGNTEGGNG